MTWFDKYKSWRRRADQEREALAASVQELTSREGSSDDKCGEEEEDAEVSAGSTGSAVLIPPRLSLQSRPLPIVRAEAAKHIPVKHEPEQGARVSHPEVSVALPGKRLGHSTKVRLQAVRPGLAKDRVTERVPAFEAPEPRESARDGLNTRDGQAIVRRIESPAALSPVSPPSLLCGRGVIEADREDVTIHNPHISAQSVVTVMLAGNPGPVVVHYISLQPRAGFTLHMSAPVVATTPFNYAVWLF